MWLAGTRNSLQSQRHSGRQSVLTDLATETWKGISNVKAETEVDRAARPLVVADLRELLRGLRLDIPADARDAALLSLGWAGAAGLQGKLAYGMNLKCECFQKH